MSLWLEWFGWTFVESPRLGLVVLADPFPSLSTGRDHLGVLLQAISFRDITTQNFQILHTSLFWNLELS